MVGPRDQAMAVVVVVVVVVARRCKTMDLGRSLQQGGGEGGRARARTGWWGT